MTIPAAWPNFIATPCRATTPGRIVIRPYVRIFSWNFLRFLPFDLAQGGEPVEPRPLRLIFRFRIFNFVTLVLFVVNLF